VSPAPFVFFSDLDGTLLDHDTYAWGAARPALERLRQRRIPLVLCTSKTRSEVEPLRFQMQNSHPFVTENGGAVFIPVRYFPFATEGAERSSDYEVIPIGTPYASLVAALERASRASGVAVRSFSKMSDEEVAAATGLLAEQARLARQREFDEPFEIVDAGQAGALLTAIEQEGMRWTTGGRFYHIHGRNDKGAAVRLLASLYRRALGEITTVGAGDAANDAGFLNEVDVPILIHSPRLDRLRALVPQGRVTRLSGPAGWNETVLALLAVGS